MTNILLIRHSTAQTHANIARIRSIIIYLLYGLIIQTFTFSFLFERNYFLIQEIKTIQAEINTISSQSTEISNLTAHRKKLLNQLGNIKEKNCRSSLLTKNIFDLIQSQPNSRISSISFINSHLEMVIFTEKRQMSTIESYLNKNSFFKKMLIEKNISNLNGNIEIHISSEQDNEK